MPLSAATSDSAERWRQLDFDREAGTPSPGHAHILAVITKALADSNISLSLFRRHFRERQESAGEPQDHPLSNSGADIDRVMSAGDEEVGDGGDEEGSDPGDEEGSDGSQAEGEGTEGGGKFSRQHVTPITRKRKPSSDCSARVVRERAKQMTAVCGGDLRGQIERMVCEGTSFPDLLGIVEHSRVRFKT